ncbi:unnamed protein product [Brassica oleracea]
MGFSKEEISKSRRFWSSLWRGIKTVFVLFTMFLSFLLVSAPIFLAVADALLPSALLHHLSASANLSSHLTNYDFRHSLIDIPLISIVRSAVILCVYGLCDGPKLSRGPYLMITMICSVSSLIYVSLKAAFVFGEPANGDGGGSYFKAAEVALFLCSSVLAIGHIVVAYRTSCRERRKLLVFKIDIEAHVKTCTRDIKRSFNKRDSNSDVFQETRILVVNTCTHDVTLYERVYKYKRYVYDV